ncbi:acetyltransferase (GNAT) family protein [Nonomuraea polychroma]|uniref:Acetyltransferase (GNAT) family protein n=1 Tax=Nonomuraea polychroma TaxID=46176 RepID=A0A438MH03_9ACTN|nr:GNAT family N-acetyltransferase [Nonomuraea polychroma]RVX45054.1 acetyltransferase (GNAT) family protein [Nonomuraea polychroma]
METLADLLSEVQLGRMPDADGNVTILAQPSPRDLGVIAFTAHSVIFADVDPDWIRDRLPAGHLSAPLGPPFLQALAEETGRSIGSVDLLALAESLPGSPPVPLDEITGSDHPRVARARRYRDSVRVWSGQGGLLTIGRGVAGRWEVAVEVEPAYRGRGVGRILAASARRLVPEPVWAQVAPGNAASVRAFLAAGYVPVGAEVLLSRHG